MSAGVLLVGLREVGGVRVDVHALARPARRRRSGCRARRRRRCRSCCLSAAPCDECGSFAANAYHGTPPIVGDGVVSAGRLEGRLDVAGGRHVDRRRRQDCARQHRPIHGGGEAVGQRQHRRVGHRGGRDLAVSERGTVGDDEPPVGQSCVASIGKSAANVSPSASGGDSGTQSLASAQLTTSMLWPRADQVDQNDMRRCRPPRPRDTTRNAPGRAPAGPNR